MTEEEYRIAKLREMMAQTALLQSICADINGYVIINGKSYTEQTAVSNFRNMFELIKIIRSGAYDAQHREKQND